MAINPNAYMAVVDTWRPQTKQFKEAFDDYKRWAGAPAGTEWTGRTANAAYERAALDCHGSDNADDAAEDIVRLASATITHEVLPPLNNGKAMIENALRAKDQGVSIDQSFNMTYTPPEGMSEETAAKNRQHVEEAERQIKEYVANWEKGCQTLKTQADTAAQKITGCINPKTALVDGRKILRDAVGSKPGDGPATATATTVSATSGKPHGIVAGMQDIAGAGDTKPAGTTGAETVADYKKWYPKDAVNVGDKNVDPAKLGGVGSIPGVREGDPANPAKLAPTLADRDVPAFAQMTRERLQKDPTVPADQIEQRVNDAVRAAQAPRFMPDAEPMRTPGQVPLHNSPGDQFNDIIGRASDSATKTVDGQIEQAKILTGQAGPGAPGVAEAWKQVGLGAIQQAHELTTDPLAAPKMGIEQAKDFYNHPGEFIGKNIIHGTEALATGAIGGEAAAGARGLLGDLTGTEGRALTHGLDDAAPGHHSAPGGDHHAPASSDQGGSGGWNHSTEHYSPHAPGLASDLNSAYVNGHPTADLAAQVADHSTHHAPGISSNANPDRVVLGKWDGQDGGYIGEARNNGGIYFDTGDDTWNAVGRGLDDAGSRSLGWQVNEQFLRAQLENRVPRVDYVLPEGFSSVEQVAAVQRRSFSAMEINFLKENAAAYGYVQQGNVWVYTGGK